MLLLRGNASALQCAAMMRATASSMEKKGKVIVISGPTGAGKSSVAIELAKRLGGEIISADSVQVYKGLDVGSAKTPVSERQGVPHHLLDIIQPTEEYSVGDFFRDAREATDTVLARGRVPIVVGGTGLYLLWYMNGRPNTPKATKEQADAVDEEMKGITGGWDAAIKYLADAGDPESAQSIARNDWYRLRRALEILKISGKPRASFPLPWMPAKESVPLDETSDLKEIVRTPPQVDYDFRCYFLYTKRSDLYRRIDLRCEQMLTEGLLQEASWFLDLGIQPNSSPPSRAIGYRQAMEYLVTCRSAGGVSSPKDFLTFLSGFQKASRNYAKRQLCWFRDEDKFRWLNSSLPADDIVASLVSDHHNSPGNSEPSAWETEQKATMVKEVKVLKTYVTRNRIFTEDGACSRPLDWLKSTQSTREILSDQV
ncbi:unnamed protein product [Calypogeia fissa]